MAGGGPGPPTLVSLAFPVHTPAYLDWPEVGQVAIADMHGEALVKAQQVAKKDDLRGEGQSEMQGHGCA